MYNVNEENYDDGVDFADGDWSDGWHERCGNTLFKEKSIYALTFMEFRDKEFICIFKDGDFSPLASIHGNYDVVYPPLLPLCNQLRITSVKKYSCA